MCVNFRPPDPEMLDAVMGVIIDLHDTGFWKTETWKDYGAPIVRRGAGGQREGLVATYGMVPRKRIPDGVKPFDTMNARAETVGQLRSFSGAWKRSQLCLVPMTAFYEPNYESGKPVRWGIGMADQSMFAVAGLWREWEGEAGSEHSFTQLTINADEHPLMRRFHKPGDEKRALVIVPRAEWDDWLDCKDPEFARSFLRHYPAESMRAWEFPVPPARKESRAGRASARQADGIAMNEELEDGRPPVGSLVRMIGDPDGQIMEVMNPALGEQHDWEGVRNGIYCVWHVDGEERFEVFRPGQLQLISPNASQSTSGE